MIYITLLIPFMFLWGFTLVDVFVRKDIHYFAKFLWVMAILFLPIVGVIVYFIARPKDYDSLPGSMDAYSTGYYQPPMSASGPSPTASDLDTLSRLHDTGNLSDSEYASIKERILAA